MQSSTPTPSAFAPTTSAAAITTAATAAAAAAKVVECAAVAPAALLLPLPYLAPHHRPEALACRRFPHLQPALPALALALAAVAQPTQPSHTLAPAVTSKPPSTFPALPATSLTSSSLPTTKVCMH